MRLPGLLLSALFSSLVTAAVFQRCYTFEPSTPDNPCKVEVRPVDDKPLYILSYPESVRNSTNIAETFSSTHDKGAKTGFTVCTASSLKRPECLNKHAGEFLYEVRDKELESLITQTMIAGTTESAEFEAPTEGGTHCLIFYQDAATGVETREKHTFGYGTIESHDYGNVCKSNALALLLTVIYCLATHEDFLSAPIQVLRHLFDRDKVWPVRTPVIDVLLLCGLKLASMPDSLLYYAVRDHSSDYSLFTYFLHLYYVGAVVLRTADGRAGLGHSTPLPLPHLVRTVIGFSPFVIIIQTLRPLTDRFVDLTPVYIAIDLVLWGTFAALLVGSFLVPEVAEKTMEDPNITKKMRLMKKCAVMIPTTLYLISLGFHCTLIPSRGTLVDCLVHTLTLANYAPLGSIFLKSGLMLTEFTILLVSWSLIIIWGKDLGKPNAFTAPVTSTVKL